VTVFISFRISLNDIFDRMADVNPAGPRRRGGVADEVEGEEGQCENAARKDDQPPIDADGVISPDPAAMSEPRLAAGGWTPRPKPAQERFV